ncbi:hypothetical protein JCM10207_006366 [Rhodosporidiobolus poonsookiae]
MSVSAAPRTPFYDLPVELVKHIVLLSTLPPHPSSGNKTSSARTLAAIARTSRALYYLYNPLLWRALDLHSQVHAQGLIRLPENEQTAALFAPVRVVRANARGGVGLYDVKGVLERLPRVQTIRLNHLFWNVGFGLEEFAHLQELATLELSDFRLPDASRPFSLPHLTSLSLSLRTAPVAERDIPLLLSPATVPSLKALFLGTSPHWPFQHLPRAFVDQLDVLAFPLSQFPGFARANQLHSCETLVAAHLSLSDKNASQYLYPAGACFTSLASTLPALHLYVTLSDDTRPGIVESNLGTLLFFIKSPFASPFFLPSHDAAQLKLSLHLPEILRSYPSYMFSGGVILLEKACEETRTGVFWHNEGEEKAGAVSPAMWRFAREMKQRKEEVEEW